MLLVQATRFGGPEVLAARQAPDPVAGPEEYPPAVAAAARAALESRTAVAKTLLRA